MKFLRLLRKNLTRNLLRSFLTFSTISVSLFLVATLMTALHELQNPPETPDSALRLIVRHRVSLFNALPIAYRDKIRQIEGVQAVSGSMWFGGVYKDPSNFFAQFSVDTDQFFEIYPDILVPEDQIKAFKEDRTGALVGNQLITRFGWKVGDKIHLKGALFRFDPELTIRAVYEEGPDGGNTLYFHWEYFNQGMNDASFTGTYTIRARTPQDIPIVSEAVDELFKNANPPTKTETEKAFILGFISMLGNLQFLVASVCTVVIFTIILVAANTMAMAIRERGREIAILKALGFSKRLVLSLLLSESVMLAMGGALAGSLGAAAIFSVINVQAVTGGMFPPVNVTGSTILICAAIGALVGLAASGFPAWRASQVSVAEALRRTV